MVNVIRKLNFVLILLMLLFVSLSAVSAAEDINETLSISDAEINDGGEILSASYTVTPANYNQYFSSSNGQLIDSAVNSGDTLTLSGDFSSKNFVLTKKVTIVGSGATINNGVFTIKKGGSGSELSNLKIINDGEGLQGFFLDGATNCYIHNNIVNNTGVSSYTICLNTDSNTNVITHNTLQTKGATYGHGSRSTSVIVLGGAHNNYIAFNTIYCADANAIYLSTYGNGGIFKGGESNNNIIYKNNITYTVNPTSWAYAIQLMGSNNTADSNIINGAYRGVSSSNLPNNKAINNVIFVRGLDFSTNATTGGDYGIALASNAIIKNNTITGMFTGSAISAASNSVVEDNYVNAQKGYAMDANGDNVKIRNNELHTQSSAVVHQQGKYSGIVVDRNTLISNSGVGVLLLKSSKTKYPSNITITNNAITTSNEYMINAADADKNSWTIRNNTGSGKILTPAGEVDPSVPEFIFNGTTHYITPDNYHNFIDGDGNLMSEVVHDGDILNFNGEFDDKQILLTRSVKLTGINPKFNNSTFIVTTDSVWIENLTVLNKHAARYNAWAIFIADTQNVKIINNDISVYDPAAAYAIYIYQSSKVYVEDNKLFSNGESLTYTLLGYGAENCEFKNNDINCLGTGEIHVFEDSKNLNANTSEVCIGQCLGDVLKEHCLDGTNIVPEIYRTYGVLMIKSSDNLVDKNRVYVTSLVDQSLAVNSTNSIVGVDFYYNCDNNIVSNNNITVEGKDNYLYGAGALAQSTGQFSSSTAKNNTFTKNNILVNGYNVVEGLIFGQGCENTNINDNIISLNTPRIAYGINLEASDKSVIEDNDVNINAGVAYGIEAYDSSYNQILNNDITGTGSIISGIAGTKTTHNLIQNNVITSNGNNSKLNFAIHDVVRAPNSGIFLDSASTNNVINENTIETLNGYPVDLSKDSVSNTITNNFLKGPTASSNSGVNNSNNNVVNNNYGSTFDNVKMNDMTSQYLDKLVITVTTLSAANGAVVQFKIGNNVIGNVTVSNAQARLSVNLDKNYPVGNYTVTATLTKSGFKTSSVTAKLNVVKANISVETYDIVAKAGTTTPFTAKVTTLSGTPIAQREVRFYRNTNYIGSATTDENGVASVNLKIPASLTGTFTILALVYESDNFLQGSAQAVLTISDKAKIFTQIEVNNVEMYYNDGTRLVVTLKDLDGNILKNKAVSITINGVTSTKQTNDNGRVSSPLKLNTGTHIANIVFNGDSGYEASSVNATVTIKSSLQSHDVELMYMNGTRFYVAVLVNNRPVSGEKIIFNINGVIYTRTTNAIGTVSMPLKLPANKYIVTAERESTGEKVSNTVIVKSLLTENKDITLFYKNGSGYTVKVTKQDGTPAGKGETVSFNINGVFYYRNTSDKGVARLNLKLNPGDYVITAEYKNCRVSNKIKILPVLSASDLTKTYAESKAFQVKLVDGKGKPLVNASIKFNINGVFYDRITHDGGIAKLNIRLQPGKYIITSSYNGANIANTVTVTA